MIYSERSGRHAAACGHGEAGWSKWLHGSAQAQGAGWQEGAVWNAKRMNGRPHARGRPGRFACSLPCSRGSCSTNIQYSPGFAGTMTLGTVKAAIVLGASSRGAVTRVPSDAMPHVTVWVNWGPFLDTHTRTRAAQALAASAIAPEPGRRSNAAPHRVPLPRRPGLARRGVALLHL